MESNEMRGLTEDEVLGAEKNTLKKSPWYDRYISILVNQIYSFFFVILVASGFLSLFFGSVVDAWIFFVIAIINASIGGYQEYSSAVEAKKLQLGMKSIIKVRRNYKDYIIPYDEIVKGDYIHIFGGVILPVDIVVLESRDVYIDTSSLTGESLPRLVSVGQNISAGTIIVGGIGFGKVTTVGKNSSLSQFYEHINNTKKNDEFSVIVKKISTNIMIMTVCCLIITIVVGSVFKNTETKVIEYILFSIAMFVGVVPESLPLVITIILSKEAVSLSKKGVIIKQNNVLENLGQMDILLSDKTGTITENRLSVRDLVSKNKDYFKKIISITTSKMYDGNPLDQIFNDAIKEYLQNEVSNNESFNSYVPYEYVKGYAEFDCGEYSILRGKSSSLAVTKYHVYKDEISALDECESEGCRVLSYAIKSKNSIEYVGSVIFLDPIKYDVVDTCSELHKLGVGIRIVTGDNKIVSEYVAKTIFPQEIKKYTVCSLLHSPIKNREYAIYCDCTPSEKMDIMNNYTENHVVGFMGEGINDALVLKASSVGFVVSNATDLARKFADVILKEKSLQPVVDAVKMSRQSILKIKTYLMCTLAGNMGTLFSVTLATIFMSVLPMLPVQILLNNLLTDIPFIFLIYETYNSAEIGKPIKLNARSLFNKILIFAGISSVFDMIFLGFFIHKPIAVLQTGWFIFSVVSEILLVLSLRTNKSLWNAPKMKNTLRYALLSSVGISLLVTMWSFTQKVFSFQSLNVQDFCIIIGVLFFYVLANEAYKYFTKRSKNA